MKREEICQNEIIPKECTLALENNSSTEVSPLERCETNREWLVDKSRRRTGVSGSNFLHQNIMNEEKIN